MQIRHLYVTDSLWRLLAERARDSRCVALLESSIRELAAVGRSGNLAEPDSLPGNYFSFREKSGMISYMPKGKTQQINEDGSWKLKGRQSMKPARWMKAMFAPAVAATFSDHVYTEFSDIVKHEELKGKITFKTVPVAKAYQKENFVDNIPSCMWGQPVGDFYEAFGCKAMIAVDYTDAWVGRAIIWPDIRVGDSLPLLEDGPGEGVTFLDRIYARSEEVSMAMRDEAQKRGWWRKAFQTRELDRPFINPDGESVHLMLLARAKRSLSDISFYPYLDTLQFGGLDYVTNVCREEKYTYNLTDGHREGDRDGQVRDYDGTWIDEENAVEVNGYWYRMDDPRVAQCYTSDDYVLKSECYLVHLGNSEGRVYIHQDHVRRAH